MRRLVRLCSAAEAPSLADLKACVAAVSIHELTPLAVYSDRASPRPVGRLEQWSSVTSEISCLTLVSNPKVSVTIFVLAPGTCLPLHDHPGMVVVQRLLLGRIHELSFDWAAPEQTASRGSAAKAVVVRNEWREHSDTCVFGPTSGGVMHALSAGRMAPAVFLDVISPPYFSPPLCVDITYFDIRKQASVSSPHSSFTRCVGAQTEDYIDCGLAPGDIVELVPSPQDATPAMLSLGSARHG